MNELRVLNAKLHENMSFTRYLRYRPLLDGLEIEIEIEIVYNMYRMRRFYTKNHMRRLLSMGPPNYAIQGTYKSGLDR
jgi:hypothetical protein